MMMRSNKIEFRNESIRHQGVEDLFLRDPPGSTQLLIHHPPPRGYPGVSSSDERSGGSSASEEDAGVDHQNRDDNDVAQQTILDSLQQREMFRSWDDRPWPGCCARDPELGRGEEIVNRDVRVVCIWGKSVRRRFHRSF